MYKAYYKYIIVIMISNKHILDNTSSVFCSRIIQVILQEKIKIQINQS